MWNPSLDATQWHNIIWLKKIFNHSTRRATKDSYIRTHTYLPTHPLLHTYLSTNSYLPTHSYIPTYLPTPTYPPTPTYLPIYQLLPTHPLLHTYLSTNSHLPTHSYLPTYLPDLWLFPCLQMQQQFTQYEFLFLNWFATRRGTPWWMDGWMDGWWVDRKILFHLGSQLPIIIGHLYYAPRLVVPRSYVPRDYRSLPGEMVYPLGT
jgi:hypothetical protein